MGIISGTMKELFHVPPITIMTLAALTPKNWEIELIDERFEKIPDYIDADLIAISVITVTSTRAFEISDKLKQMNPKLNIIMGGIHPSLNTYECLDHCDSVCICHF